MYINPILTNNGLDVFIVSGVPGLECGCANHGVQVAAARLPLQVASTLKF
jgi:hypothetical protein